MNDRPLTLTCSLADQAFAQAKSIGIFNLSLGLVAGLARRPEIAKLTLLANRTLAGHLPEGVDVRWHDAPARGKLRRFWWDQWGVYSAAAAAGHEWLFLPKGFTSFLRPPPMKLAVYVHDAMHDYYRRRHPAAVSASEQAYFTRALLASLRHARVIFTNTEFTAGEVRRLAAEAGQPVPALVVAGIGFTRPAAPLEAKEDRVVLMAARCPRKRTDLALEWLFRWQRDCGFTGEVDCVGSLPPGLAFPSRPGWRWHERMPESEHRQLIACAKALAFFTDYEGFGMPPVEAVLSGACPVFSDIPATREVMGGCGFAFANSDYESFRVAMNSALGAAADTVTGWAEELLARHNWNRVLDRIVAGLQAAPAETPLKPARP